MREVVLVDAVRSPVTKRNGSLSRKHATDLLADVMVTLLKRTGVAGADIDHVLGGCVSQVGMQAANVTRNAWLAAGLPEEVPAVTTNAQCGSSQEALLLGRAQIASGMADIVLVCGVESMSQVPLTSTTPVSAEYGMPRTGGYSEHYEVTTQFEGSDRIAEQWDISREDLELFAKRSQDLAAAAWDQGRFDSQVVPVEAPFADESGQIVGSATVTRDEGMRPTTLEGLAKLKVNQPDRAQPGRHTAGTTSQVSDGAAAVLLMSREKADNLGLRPRARIVESILVGSDPVLMLTGPIPATRKVLQRSGLSLSDIDLFEVNEAFAAVVCAWIKEFDVDVEKVNVNGGAIALGHPLGATGVVLVTKLMHELERAGKRYGLSTMCCGGGLGTGILLERL